MKSAVAMLLVLLAFACSAPREDDPTLELPRIDGSTSTHPLGRLVACRILGLDYRWELPAAMERTVVAASEDRRVTSIVHSGTHGAYANLVEDGADLILVARAPSLRELEAAQAAGISLDARPVARDALVFVVNAENPVESLTIEQIQSIFGTEGVPRWSDLGGPAEMLRPYQRQQDSGSQELMQRLVMGDRPMIDEGRAPLIFSMGGVVNTMAVQRWGLSFSVYYYIVNMKPNPLARLLAIEGVSPTSETIFDSTYPLISEVFVVIRSDAAPDSAEAALRDWLLTADGQAVIEEAGYVPLPK